MPVAIGASVDQVASALKEAGIDFESRQGYAAPCENRNYQVLDLVGPDGSRIGILTFEEGAGLVSYQMRASDDRLKPPIAVGSSASDETLRELGLEPEPGGDEGSEWWSGTLAGEVELSVSLGAGDEPVVESVTVAGPIADPETCDSPRF